MDFYTVMIVGLAISAVAISMVGDLSDPGHIRLYRRLRLQLRSLEERLRLCL